MDDNLCILKFTDLQKGSQFKLKDSFGIEGLQGIFTKHSKTLFMDQSGTKRKFWPYMGLVVLVD